MPSAALRSSTVGEYPRASNQNRPVVGRVAAEICCRPGDRCHDSERAAQTQEIPRFPRKTSAVATSTPNRARVLVVDDEPNILEVISMALRYHGFNVETAEDGQHALAAVSAFQPDLMLLDIMLPDMEGFEVARRLGAQ